MDKIARIRQEIKRLRQEIKEEKEHIALNQKVGYLFALTDMESFLDILSLEPDKSLEEEIERYLHSIGLGYGGWVDGLGDDDLRNLARHFAEWGTEHLYDSTKMIGKSLEEVAINYSNSWYCSALEELNGTGIGCTGIADAFKAGAEWALRYQEKKIADAYEKGKQEGIRVVRSWENSPGQGGY